MISEIQGLQGLSGVNPVRNAEKISENTEVSQMEVFSVRNIDEYVPSGERDCTGLYRVSADEQGNPEVRFDALKTSESQETTTIPI